MPKHAETEATATEADVRAAPATVRSTAPPPADLFAPLGRADEPHTIPAYDAASAVLSVDSTYVAPGGRTPEDCLQAVTPRDEGHLARADGRLLLLRADMLSLEPASAPARNAAIVNLAEKAHEFLAAIQPPRAEPPNTRLRSWADEAQEVIGTSRLVDMVANLQYTAAKARAYAGTAPEHAAPAAAVVSALADAANHLIFVKDARAAFVKAKLALGPDDPFWSDKSYTFTAGIALAVALLILYRPRSTPQLERDVVRLGLLSEEVVAGWRTTAGPTVYDMLLERAATWGSDVRKLEAHELPAGCEQYEVAWWAPGGVQSTLAPPDLSAADPPM